MCPVEAVIAVETEHACGVFDVEILLEIEQRAKPEAPIVDAEGGARVLSREASETDLEAIPQRVVVVARLCACVLRYNEQPDYLTQQSWNRSASSVPWRHPGTILSGRDIGASRPSAAFAVGLSSYKAGATP